VLYGMLVRKAQVFDPHATRPSPRRQRRAPSGDRRRHVVTAVLIGAAVAALWLLF
jgi:hypothetical protein